MTEPRTTWGLVRYFLYLGSLGFGGPVALIGYMPRDLVERQRWSAWKLMRLTMGRDRLLWAVAGLMAVVTAWRPYRLPLADPTLHRPGGGVLVRSRGPGDGYRPA
jgi:chromate transporter